MILDDIVKHCDRLAEILASKIAAANVAKQTGVPISRQETYSRALTALALIQCSDSAEKLELVLSDCPPERPEFKNLPTRIFDYHAMCLPAIRDCVRALEDLGEEELAKSLREHLQWQQSLYLEDLDMKKFNYIMEEFVDSYLGENSNVHNLRN